MIPLVVIDMQPWFTSGLDRLNLIGNVEKHVKRAIKQNAPVVIVEFVGNGETLDSILDLLEGYNNWIKTYKKDRDGSKEVADILDSTWGIKPPSILKICGVFTDQCVGLTANSLDDMGFNIKIIEEACYSVSHWHHCQISSWEDNGNVKVIYKSQDYLKGE